MKARTDAEALILQTFNQQSIQLGAEIQELSSKIEGISLGRYDDAMKNFRSDHEAELDRLSQKVEQIMETQNPPATYQEVLGASVRSSGAKERIVESLFYPQIQARKEQISDVFEGTYGWMFRNDATSRDAKDSFVSWLTTRSTKHNVYWVSGKPGSGKSTLMRFVDQTLETDYELLPWTEAARVIKASHFVWKAGTSTQRSSEFLLRSLLYQLLDQAPDRIAPSVTQGRWKSASSPNRSQPEWALPELSQTLRSFAQNSTFCVFILIDGLDELEDMGGRQKQLVQLIQNIGSFQSIKLCVSSRPENIFRDAFENSPHLQLHNLTSADIQTFICGQFDKHPRLLALSRMDNKLVDTLLNNIAVASSGVFLWVCLVVREVLEEARDGASIAELIETVDKVPNDLDTYFSRIMGSIEPKHKVESSIMFQIALQKEDGFSTGNALRLLDLSFLEERHTDFALRPRYNSAKCDLSNAGFRIRLDTASRRVNSRCKGLLEIQYIEGETERMLHLDQRTTEPTFTTSMAPGEHAGPYVANQEDTGLLRAYNYHVNFLHRSFHDYLLEPENLERLEQASMGRYNARLFLCNARLVQILSLDYTRRPAHARLAFVLASYVITAISVEDLKFSKECALIAAQMRPVVELLAQRRAREWTDDHWYLTAALRYYDAERDNFLVVAIDFDLVAYVKEYLTRDAITSKMGRPILANVLQPTVIFGYRDHDTHVNVEILRLVLDLGADPNEPVDSSSSISVWGWLLESLLYYDTSQSAKKALHTVEAIRILLEHSADPLLPSERFKQLTSNSAHRATTTTMSAQESDTRRGMISVAKILRHLPKRFTLHVAQELNDCILLAKERAAIRGFDDASAPS
ncbi:hypothetical protein PG993_012594 [Apiospora rasikravindrae]|uniref:NACHT domain-containing protein n=1 Tax=Apiospora rasikravindrae TaxID=990691 RepID=A0ABR1S313_9PEZI